VSQHGLIDAFVGETGERCTERVHARDHARVMVSARAFIASPIVSEEKGVQIERLHFTLAVLHFLHGQLAEGNWRQTRRGVQALLRGGIHAINLESISVERRSAQRRDCIDDEQRVVLVTEIAEAVQLLADARGALALDEEDRLG